MTSSIYFSDNFFSIGLTNIFNESKDIIGSLNLHSAFTSSVSVLDLKSNTVCEGKFKLLSNRWFISSGGKEMGELKYKISFSTKKYEYNAFGRNIVNIESEAFSNVYRMFDERKDRVAEFKSVSGFFQAPSYQLTNYSEQFTNAELIAIVMGVQMIKKRNDSAAANSHHS